MNEKNSKKILSIGMIVKNEEKHLRKCLTALQPILSALKETGGGAELIIADTGSTDNTIAIAKEFADKVLQTEWNDNFAEARNHTVKAAQGEWYMYLDADEIWQETGDLIKFFTSGEYKKYNSAAHLLHDKMSDGQTRQITLSRLFKLEKDTAFKGIVHEAIPYKNPQKSLKSYSVHLGHSQAAPEEAAAKKERNAKLMQRAYETDPTNTHNLVQLCLATIQNEEPDKLKKYLDTGFKIVKNNTNHESFHFFYRHMALFFYRAGEWQQAISLVQEYLKKAPQTVAAIDMYHIMADSYLKSGDADKAFSSFEKCYALIKKLKSNKLNTEPAAFDVLNALNPNFAPVIRTAIKELKTPKRGIQTNKGNARKGPKLSIGMIVKNESKNLRKCLTDLQPILTQTDSELIIADTGSTDDTVTIAKEFTDKVLQIEWTNDFAAARNHTLQAAKGEWYMYLDADEFWQETDDLVAFFNSGEYRKYNSAMHARTDLLESGAIKHANSLRLCKIDADTKFISPIHEYLNAKPPTKNLVSFSHHIGYAYETEEIKQFKAQRNMELMLATHEKEPDNLHIVAQICMQTMGVDDEQFLKFVNYGFEKVKNKPSASMFHFFYRRLQHHYFNSHDFESAIRIGAEYLKIAMPSVAAIDICAMLADSYKELKMYKDAAAAGERTKELLAKMNAGLLDMEPASRDILLCVNPEFEGIINDTLIFIYNTLGEFKKLFELCKKADPAKTGFVDFYLSAIDRTAMYRETVPLYELIARQEDALYRQLLGQLEEYLQKSPNALHFYNAFAGLQTDDIYVNLLQLRAADARSDMLGILTLLSAYKPLLRPVADLAFAQGEALFLAFKYNALFAEVTAALDIEIIPETVAQMELKAKDFVKSVTTALAQYENSPALPNKTALWLQSITYAAILALKESKGTSTAGTSTAGTGVPAAQQDELFRYFLTFSKSYMTGTYRPENLNAQNIAKLPGLYRFTFYAGQAIDARQAGDNSRFERHMHRAIAAAPEFARVFV